MIDTIYLFILYRISMIFLLAFLCLFTPLRYNNLKTFGICLLSALISGPLEYVIIFSVSRGIAGVLITVVEIILVQATALWISRYRDFRTIFIATTAADYVLVGNIVYTIVVINLKSFLLAIILATIIHALVLGLLCIMLRNKFIQEVELRQTGWAKTILLPALFYCTIYSLIHWPADIFQYPQNELTTVFVLVIMISVYIYFIVDISGQRENAALDQSKAFVDTYKNGLKREAAVLNQTEERIALLRHDMRHEYRLIGYYLSCNQTDKIKELLEKMDVELVDTTVTRYCENITLNGILSTGSYQAREQGIDFSCQAEVPTMLKTIDEFDLATVVSNLIDNAIEAGARTSQDSVAPQVWVRLMVVKDQLLLEIKNTFAGEYCISEISGLPVSMKGKNHGFGLKSVKTYVDKHNGLFTCGVEEGKFTVKIMIDL